MEKISLKKCCFCDFPPPPEMENIDFLDTKLNVRKTFLAMIYPMVELHILPKQCSN
jgi:hypothetical protein